MTCERILVVDDEPGMLHAIDRILRRQYEVTCSLSPGEALQVLHTTDVDLILLDIQMPEMSGFEVMARALQMRPGVDVIMMTGSVHDLNVKMVQAIRGQAYYFIEKPFDREVLLAIVERCMQKRRLEEANRRYVERMERELAIARGFQHSMLPPAHACIGRVSLWASYIPSTELGGDFFDYAPCNEDSVSFVIADASGHGVSAAMLTALVKSAFQKSQDSGYEPRAVIERILTNLRSLGTERFVTAICARIHGGSGLLEYVNAGHPPGILWGPDRTLVQLTATAPLLHPGIPFDDWTQEEVPLNPGDNLLLVTDGLTDVDGEGGLFGFDRIVRQAATHATAGHRLVTEIVQAVDDYAAGRPAHDDRTLLTMNYAGARDRA